MQKTIKDILPDEVYHLAAQAYDGHSFDNEIYTFKINLNATHYIISSVREINENAKFFFAGSSEMYGSKNNAPIDEFTIFEPKSACGSKLKNAEFRHIRARSCFRSMCI